MNLKKMFHQLQDLSKTSFAVWVTLGFALLGQTPIWAAYRVYQLKVVHYDEKNRPSQRGMVVTNLDPYQYEHYQGEFGRIRIQMVDTWYCPGDTSRQAYCKKPKEKILQRGPAGLFAPKREALPYKLAPVIP